MSEIIAEIIGLQEDGQTMLARAPVEGTVAFSIRAETEEVLNRAGKNIGKTVKLIVMDDVLVDIEPLEAG